MKGKKQVWLLVISIIFLVFLAACTNPSRSDDSVKELADNNPIPEDGIITASQFRSIAGEDRLVNFTGVSPEGIEYTWTFNGLDIKNAIDQNLKVIFESQASELESIKASAANAPYGLSLKLSGDQGLVAVAEMTLKLSEKWNADAGFFCKVEEGSLAKLSDARIDHSKDQTQATFKVIETGGIYYLLAGNTAGTLAEEAGEETEESVSTPQVGQADVSEGSQQGSEPAQRNQNTCTVSINVASILNNMDKLTPGKEAFVPANGWILYPTQVAFTPGESAHDVVTRVCQAYGIHMESSFTPGYNSAYLEGINQLYEFDCGELSGWMHNINGWFPNYGISQYTVKDGDTINILYTCDLGKDIGGSAK